MERKYTPGPWTAKSYAAPRADNGDIGIINGKGMLVAVAYSNTCTRDNASLIAAAPDLVEALAAVRRYLAQCPPHAGDTTGTEHGRMMDAAGAALLKAGHDL